MNEIKTAYFEKRNGKYNEITKEEFIKTGREKYEIEKITKGKIEIKIKNYDYKKFFSHVRKYLEEHAKLDYTKQEKILALIGGSILLVLLIGIGFLSGIKGRYTEILEGYKKQNETIEKIQKIKIDDINFVGEYMKARFGTGENIKKVENDKEKTKENILLEKK